MDVKIEKEQKQQVVEVMKSRRSSIRYTAPTVKKIVKLLHWFFPKIKVRVLKNKEASLLTKLLLEIKEMSYEFS